MNTYAAVMTGKGTGAISTIQLFGDSARHGGPAPARALAETSTLRRSAYAEPRACRSRAEAIIKKIFKPTGTRPAEFETGKILLGTIHEAGETIDQVTIGCEAIDNFAIHCHGNPLIVEMIMQLLQRCGATLVTAEELLTKTLAAQQPINTIVLEAKLGQLKAQTIQGTKIITNQIDAGLSKKVAEWQENMNAMSLEQIVAEAEQILKDSRTAKLIMFGCKVAIIGPPNSGKSTLLNFLAGREKAIVTGIGGTTRDWVSATCQIEPLSVEFFDTAGLDEKLSAYNNTIEKAAQKKSIEILEQANLVLLVLDNSQPAEQLNKDLLEKVTNKKVLTVLNKADLRAKFDITKLPKSLNKTVLISAKYGTGIEELIEKILQICSVADFDLKTVVCFTDRQEKLLKQLKRAKSKRQAAFIITESLNGQA